MKQFADIQKIEKMKIAGDILSSIIAVLQKEAKVGVKLIDLDKIAEDLCVKNNVLPAFKKYEGFPNALCVGVNDVVVHGIPDEYALRNGDIVSLDMGVKYLDVFSDAAITVIIGEVDETVKTFVNTVKTALMKSIKEAKPGKHVGDIGYAIQNTVEKAGYSVVKEMVGHGIGYKLHEEPYIPGYGERGGDEKLYAGQTLAIEAIINMGGPDITISRVDGWTSRTKDGMLSALFEHTVVVDATPKLLTAW
ncbi:type I methionyl aminopeptidase [Candidatus Dojkabacteria bacterium]|jgi:methionyl aminopeptidase|nr:type I methionyl aminopeptidase [Candidatus Dojkabacteria bacterium]